MVPHFLARGTPGRGAGLFWLRPLRQAGGDGSTRSSSIAIALLAFVRRSTSGVTLVGQDWGGLLGLTLPMEMPERFSRLIVMNTALPTGEVPLPKGFLEWRHLNGQPDIAVGRLMARSCPQLSPAEAGAYDAPFPDADL